MGNHYFSANCFWKHFTQLANNINHVKTYFQNFYKFGRPYTHGGPSWSYLHSQTCIVLSTLPDTSTAEVDDIAMEVTK